MVRSRATPRAVEITEVRDPAVASSTFEFLDQDLVQLPSAFPFRARQVIVRLEGCVLVYYWTSVRVRTRPTLQRDFIAYVTFGPDAVGTANGLPVRGDAMLAVPAGHGLAVVAEPGYESASFLVRPEDVADHLSMRGRTEVLPPREQVEVLDVGAGMAGQLFGWARRLVDAVLERPELVDDSRARREAVKQDLLETLLSTLAFSSPVELARRGRTRQAQSDMVRTAEQYALAHADDRLYVKDLCQAAGVSERTLEYAFREEMALSPMAYLTRIRLHRVHEALLRAPSTSTTVTREALRWGFWHFGEFAKAYRECFHELPSDTLRRAQAGRGKRISGPGAPAPER
jgi:AraC-like DNA-binding protein